MSELENGSAEYFESADTAVATAEAPTEELELDLSATESIESLLEGVE